MQIHIAENIRNLRKEKKFTQENLAEVFGVSVAAVSKWEQGSSVPDVCTIADMAAFFGVSVDFLLGYEWKTSNMEESLAEIKKLRNEKRFDEAAVEAEKALKKWPNFLDVVLSAGTLYSLKGLETQNHKDLRKAIRLFYSAIGLLSQNTTGEVSEPMLMNKIASIHAILGETDRALEILKKYNADGANSIEIALLLVNDPKRWKESIDYAYIGLLDTLCHLSMCSEALGNYYYMTDDKENVEHLVALMVNLFESMEKDGKVSYFRRMAIHASTLGAVCAAKRGDEECTRKHLKNAWKNCQIFDAAPTWNYQDSWFFHSDKNPTAFDDFGSTAKDGVEKAISGGDNDEFADLGPEKEEKMKGLLARIWKETIEKEA